MNAHKLMRCVAMTALVVTVTVLVRRGVVREAAKDDGGALGLISAAVAVPQPQLERQIQTLQSRIAAKVHRPSDVERLGWLLVAAARAGSDDGFYALALAAADAIVDSGGDAHAAELLRGHALLSLHRFAEAQAVASALVRERGIAADHGLLGDVLLDRGRLRRAVRAYQKMMDARPDHHAYVRVAMARHAAGDLEDAIEALKVAAAAASPRNAETYAWTRARLAGYLLEAGRSDEALAQTTSALEVAPDSAAAHVARGRVLLALERPAQAVESLSRAADLAPLPSTLWALEDALEASGSSAEAAQVRERILRDGEHDDPRSFSAYLAERRLQPRRALALALEETRLRRDAHTWDTVAGAQLASSMFESAWKSFERASRGGVADPQILLHGAEAAHATGRTQQARELIERAAAMQTALLPSQRSRLDRLRGELVGMRG